MRFARQIVIIGVLGLALLPGLVLAATTTQKCSDDPNRECTKLVNPLQNDKVEVAGIIGNVIRAGLGIIGALAVFMMVLGGNMWLTSAGNAEKVSEGSKTMIWAILGLFLVFVSYLLLSGIFGVLFKK